MSIKDIFTQIDIKNDINTTVCCYGWVRTVRSSSSSLGFCTLNDGSNVSGLQIVISVDYIKQDNVDIFFKEVKIGSFYLQSPTRLN